MSEIEALASRLRRDLEARLAELGSAGGGCARLTEAMRYSLIAPAKRVRAVLTLLAARQLGVPEAAAIDPACAVEMVHAASLVIDDLPAMDDASVRRGKAANHRVYGEDTAILAAVALLNQAFAVLAGAPGLAAEQRIAMVAVLARAIGPDGLTGGQEQDLHASTAATTGPELATIHARKTGVLFAAAVEIAGLAAGVAGPVQDDLSRIGLEVGLAFQAFDDLIDARASRESAGKDVGRDAGKATAVALYGLDAAERLADAHLASAVALMRRLAPAAGGGDLAAYIDHLTQSLKRPLVEAGPVAAAKSGGGT